jgi:hypothetical protein
MKCCDQKCNQGRDCPLRKQLEDEYSIKHDIKIAAYVFLFSIALIVFLVLL